MRVTSLIHSTQRIFDVFTTKYNYVFCYFVEKKIKSMKCKHVDLPLSDDPAAGFRKYVIQCPQLYFSTKILNNNSHILSVYII